MLDQQIKSNVFDTLTAAADIIDGCSTNSKVLDQLESLEEYLREKIEVLEELVFSQEDDD